MGAIIKHSNLSPAGLPSTTCSNSLTPPCKPVQHLKGEMLVCLSQQLAGQPVTCCMCSGSPWVPSWTPGPTVAPLYGLRGPLPRGTNRFHPSATTHVHSYPMCKPGHATLPPQAAHPWLLRCVLAANTKDVRYKHNGVQQLLQQLSSVLLT